MYVSKKENENIYYFDSEFTVKELKSTKDKYEAYKLRKEIYCDELKWVQSHNQEIEVDQYDVDAILLGVLNRDVQLLGTLRIVPAYLPMMIEKEFKSLVNPFHRIYKNGIAAEISRLGVRKSLRRRNSAKVSHALYRAVYHWSIKQSVRYLYMVVEEKMLKNLKLTGFPCEIIGPVLTLPGSHHTLAAIMDWKNFDEKMHWRLPNLNNSYHQRLAELSAQ